MNKLWASNVYHSDYNECYNIYLKVAKILYLTCSHHKKEMTECDMMEALAKSIMGIILQYIRLSNQHTVHLKLTECYKVLLSQ